MQLISHLCQVPIPPPGPISIVSVRMYVIGENRLKLASSSVTKT
jgi:hypothetical protein